MALSLLFSARKDRRIRFYGKFLTAFKFQLGRSRRQTKIALPLHNDDLLPERNYTISCGWEKNVVEGAKDEKHKITKIISAQLVIEVFT